MATAWDMWHHQNQALHEEPDNHALILEHEINNNVTKLYQLGLGAFITRAMLLKHPLPDLLQLPLAYKNHWLGSVQIARTRRDKQCEGLYHSECKQMQRWVIRIPKQKQNM